MQKLQFYRANKNNTGVAVSFNFGPNREKTSIDLYASGIKQSGWNAQTNSGSFKGNAQDANKIINMKFSEFEVGGLIYALENKDSFGAYHKSDAGVTTASVRLYVPEKIKTAQGFVDNTKKTATGMSITLKKDGENAPSFPLTVSFGEATALAIYLRTGLTEKFLMYVAPAQNQNGNGNGNNSRPAPKPQNNDQDQDDNGNGVSDTSNENVDEDVPF